MGVSLEEQETHINWCRTEDGAEVFTTDRTTMTKLDRMCKEHPENYQCIRVDKFADNGELADKVYRIKDKTLISFRGAKMTKELTEEQRNAIAERFKASQARKSEDFDA